MVILFSFCYRQDWSHAYYIGKLCEKLGFSSDISLSYYDKAIALNPTAVDPVYRMHASRLKILFKCGKQNLEALKVSFSCFSNLLLLRGFDKIGFALCFYEFYIISLVITGYFIICL